jgi:hypothetical protein
VWGFNFHDDDLVPFGSSAAEMDRILREARQVMDGEGIVNSMVICNLFEQPVFKDYVDNVPTPLFPFGNGLGSTSFRLRATVCARNDDARARQR